MQAELQNEKAVPKENEKVRVYQPPIPFPRRLKQTKLDDQFAKYLNMFRNLELNIHFAEALSQIPNYAKFMEDIINKKWKLDEKWVVSLSANCSALIQKKLPQKMQDPRRFTILCISENHEFGKALCDSGASINLMPLLVI